MTVTDVDTDYDNLVVTLTVDFEATVEQVWRLWEDPRKLEGWWGPPSYPATVDKYELTPGGHVTYYMTGPGGDRYRGWWKVKAIAPPNSMEFIDGFADQDGMPADMPTTVVQVGLSTHAGGTRMLMRSHFDTREHMEELEKMGMIEGMTLAVGQMDALIAR